MVVRIHLFGRLEARTARGDILSLRARKVQEFLGYVLLSRNRRLPRERLAQQLWPDVESRDCKKYLRHAVWQLRRAFDEAGAPGLPLLDVRQDWIGVRGDASVSVDVWELELAHEASVAAPDGELPQQLRGRLRSAVELYRGELLEGWDHDWCAPRRDAYRDMYVTLLNRLVLDATSAGDWEAGLAYGRRALREDSASERTHVLMMQLHLMAGDRTAALRQFELCRSALLDELGVEPDERTMRLYDTIRGWRAGLGENVVPFAAAGHRADGVSAASHDPVDRVGAMLVRLRELSSSLSELQEEVGEHIDALERLRGAAVLDRVPSPYPLLVKREMIRRR